MKKMIIDRPESHFIFVLPWAHEHTPYNYIQYKGKELTTREYLEFWGKWILFGTREELDVIAQNLDPLVEKRIIPALKYDREVLPAFGLGKCVMCVFCDFRQRETVWNVLLSQGIDDEDKAWVFERDTLEMWQPGGRLLEAWISGEGLNSKEADMVRENAKKKFAEMFGDKDAIFRGVNQ